MVLSDGSKDDRGVFQTRGDDGGVIDGADKESDVWIGGDGSIDGK